MRSDDNPSMFFRIRDGMTLEQNGDDFSQKEIEVKWLTWQLGFDKNFRVKRVVLVSTDPNDEHDGWCSP